MTPHVLPSFVPSFFRSFVPSFVPSFLSSFLRSFVRSFPPSFVRSFLPSFPPSFVRSFISDRAVLHYAHTNSRIRTFAWALGLYEPQLTRAAGTDTGATAAATEAATAPQPFGASSSDGRSGLEVLTATLMEAPTDLWQGGGFHLHHRFGHQRAAALHIGASDAAAAATANALLADIDAAAKPLQRFNATWLGGTASEAAACDFIARAYYLLLHHSPAATATATATTAAPTSTTTTTTTHSAAASNANGPGPSTPLTTAPTTPTSAAAAMPTPASQPQSLLTAAAASTDPQRPQQPQQRKFTAAGLCLVLGHGVPGLAPLNSAMKGAGSGPRITKAAALDVVRTVFVGSLAEEVAARLRGGWLHNAVVEEVTGKKAVGRKSKDWFIDGVVEVVTAYWLREHRKLLQFVLSKFHDAALLAQRFQPRDDRPPKAMLLNDFARVQRIQGWTEEQIKR